MKKPLKSHNIKITRFPLLCSWFRRKKKTKNHRLFFLFPGSVVLEFILLRLRVVLMLSMSKCLMETMMKAKKKPPESTDFI